MHRNPLKRTVAALAMAAALVAGLGTAASAQVDGSGAAGQKAGAGVRASQKAATMDDLLHPYDVSDAFSVRQITSHVGADGGGFALSACTGETRLRDLVGAQADLFHADFRGRVRDVGRKFIVSQQAAGMNAGTVARTTRTYRRIVHMVRGCRHEPAGHWHYGKGGTLHSRSGKAIWMPTINGNGNRHGGIVVARDGRHLTVAEVTHGGNRRQVKDLARHALHRIR